MRVGRGFTPNGLVRVRASLEEMIEAGRLPGVVAVLWRDGQVCITATGKRDIEADIPMDEASLFRIASMTKPITSVAALVLVEEGWFRLDDPICRWAPELARMRVLRSPSGALEDVEDACRDITFEDLLTHRSGLSYSFTSQGPLAEAYRDSLGDVRSAQLDPDGFLRALGGLPLQFQPGERFHYGHSSEVLGHVLGRIVGRPFREVVREKVLDPLGMIDTDFFVPPEKRHRLAALYSQKGTHPPGRTEFTDPDSPPPFARGGGGLISTAADYLGFSKMLLQQGELDGVRLLSPGMANLMVTNQLSVTQRRRPLIGPPLMAGQGFGLGVSVIVDEIDFAAVGPGAGGSYAWGGAFGTWWRVDPANNMILLYLTQNMLVPDAANVAEHAQERPAQAASPLSVFQKGAYDARQH